MYAAFKRTVISLSAQPDAGPAFVSSDCCVASPPEQEDAPAAKQVLPPAGQSHGHGVITHTSRGFKVEEIQMTKRREPKRKLAVTNMYSMCGLLQRPHTQLEELH